MSMTLQMPKLSDTMTAGTIVKWLKKVGDPLAKGEPYADVETDKATMPLIAPVEGILVEILAPEGSQVLIGGPVGKITSQDESVAAGNEEPIAAIPAEGELRNMDQVESPDASGDVDEIPAPVVEDNQDTFIAHAIEGENASNLDTASSNPHSIEDDTQDSMEKKGSDDEGVDMTNPTPQKFEGDDLPPNETDEPGPLAKSEETMDEEDSLPIDDGKENSITRSEKKGNDIQLMTLEKDIDATNLIRAKTAINEYLSKGQESEVIKSIAINDFIICSVSKAIEIVPEINIRCENIKPSINGVINLSFSVSLPTGFARPVIHDTSSKNLISIAVESRELVNKARANNLLAEDESDPTFAIANIALRGIDYYQIQPTPPVAACLSVASPMKKAIITDDDLVTAGFSLRLGLCCNQRVIDSSVAASFLKELAIILENPEIAML